MFDAIVHDVVGPILRRAGTAVGSVLAGLGVAHDDINVIVAGAVALGGVAIDLGLIYLRNKGRR